MGFTPASRVSRLALAGALAVVTALGCQDGQGPDVGPAPVLAALIVSNPSVPSLAAAAPLRSGSAAGFVFASLPPGNVPNGNTVVIQNRRTGAQVTAALVNGGFDPVSVAAAAGDTLDIRISVIGQAQVLRFIKVVPALRPPVIVRTDPPEGKRDVPLNAVMLLVFSEPVDSATLTNSSVKLMLGGVPVAGTLAFADPSRLNVTFTPAGPLTVGSDYALVMSQEIEDLTGEPLQAPVTVSFATVVNASPSAGTFVRVTPHRLPGYSSNYVFYFDGTFELRYQTQTWGDFAYTGKYSIADSIITLDFDANRPQWVATATIRGDSLVVACNPMMLLDDFEDGVYVLSQGIGFPALDGGPGIYLASADGSALSWLVRGNHPAWSPDGQRLAYDRSGEIYVINSDGSNEMPVAAGIDPTWSPDGSRIAFADSTGISVIDLQSSATVQLIRQDFVAGSITPMGIGKPAWSPDGASIAFAHYGDDGAILPAQIYVMNADGSSPRRPTATPGGRICAESDPAWSPDGARLVLWDWCFGISTVDPRGSGLSTVYLDNNVASAGTKPEFTSDGTSISFTGYRWGSPGATVLYIVEGNGGGLRPLILGAYDGVWSPDGSRIALVRDVP